jgi:hypothetical protein
MFICGGGGLKSQIASVTPQVVVDLANMLEPRGSAEDARQNTIFEGYSLQSATRYHRSPCHKRGSWDDQYVLGNGLLVRTGCCTAYRISRSRTSGGVWLPCAGH